uniref:Uncharacterized protein n=1 Tax=Anopheles culicifacies TaxID=139723 RepID=A0A182MJ14_9DIPT
MSSTGEQWHHRYVGALQPKTREQTERGERKLKNIIFSSSPIGSGSREAAEKNWDAVVFVTKFIKTGIADKNDYPLYFEKVIYEADIDENVELNHNFLNVTAKTHGEDPNKKGKYLSLMKLYTASTAYASPLSTRPYYQLGLL